MDGLARRELEAAVGDADLLRHQADEVHLDAAFFPVEEGFVRELVEVEICSQFAVDAPQQIKIEGSSDPRGVIVGCVEGLVAFDQVDSNQQATVIADHAGDIPQEYFSIARLKVADG